MSEKLGADRWVEWHFRNENKGPPSGVSPVEDRGLVPLKHCPHGCKGAQPVSDAGLVTRSRTGYVCSKCEQAWTVREEVRFVGEVSASGAKKWDDKLTKRIDVSREFNAFIHDKELFWESRYYISNCMGHSIRKLTKEGPAEWGEGAPDTIWKARKAVISGRREWTYRLEKIGIKV